MPFTQPSLTQAQAALAARLNDPASVRWVLPELTAYIREALRWWNSITSTFRASGAFTLTMAQTFFDLPTVLPALRAYTVTNWELCADLQYALLEPAAAGGTWTGTDQFDLATLNTALQRRRDQFLRETGAVLTQTTTAYTATANGRYALPEAMTNVRHAKWTPNATALGLPLLRTDEWAANHFRPAWISQTTPPRWFSVSATPPLFLQVMPIPATDGSLFTISISTGAALSFAVSSLLSIPDDWAWVVKFGALADLLQADGLALDAPRAAYCESRWRQGLLLAANSPVVLTGRINSAVVTLPSLADADTFSPLWALLSGIPRQLVLAGQNLVASWPSAGGLGPYTATLDLVQNAPVPAVGADILQISQDVYDSLLDYAQHLALFKEGPGQLDTAMALYQRATAAAGIDSAIQQAAQPSRAPLLNQTNQEQHAQPLGQPAVMVE